jgi:hypothetical protein
MMPKFRVSLEVPTNETTAPGEFWIEATFTNESDAAATLNISQAEHPSLVLQVHDVNDRCVLLQPPHAPDEKDRVETIEAGQSVTLRYAGFLDRSLAPGSYRIRYFSEFAALGADEQGPLASEWIELLVGKPEKPFIVGKPLKPFFTGPLSPPGTLNKIFEVLIYLVRRFICLIQNLIDTLISIITGRPRPCRREMSQEVDVQRTETISNAPQGSEAWNGTYGWQARFHLRVEEPECRVIVTIRIRISGAITDAQRNAWESPIEAAWNNKFKLCCGGCCCIDGFPTTINIEFVDNNEHQVVNVGANTTSMTNWSATDAVDISHEVGHMLGALDEYFTVNGIDYGPGRQADGNIMNNPANDPAAHHYDLVRATAAQLLGTNCVTKSINSLC